MEVALAGLLLGFGLADASTKAPLVVLCCVGVVLAATVGAIVVLRKDL